MLGIHTMRSLLVIDVKLHKNAMAKEHALIGDGARELQGLPKMLNIVTMKLKPLTNAPLTVRPLTMLTETIIAMAKEHVLDRDFVRVFQDDLNSQLLNNQGISHFYFLIVLVEINLAYKTYSNKAKNGIYI